MPALDANATRPKWVPPYVSFKTLTGLLVRMETEGIPPRIDRSFLSSLSGGYQSQVLGALRAMGLIDEQGTVLPTLIELVNQGDRRADLVGALVRNLYPEPVHLGTVNGTQGQLEEVFKEYGVSGDTMRKSIAFYLAAAKYGGVPISRHFRVPSVTASDTRRARGRSRRAPALEPPSGNRSSETKGTEYGPTRPQDSDWVQAFDAALIAWVRRIPVGDEYWPKPKKDHWFLTFRHIVDAILPDEPEDDGDDYYEEERG